MCKIQGMRHPFQPKYFCGTVDLAAIFWISVDTPSPRTVSGLKIAYLSSSWFNRWTLSYITTEQNTTVADWCMAGKAESSDR